MIHLLAIIGAFNLTVGLVELNGLFRPSYPIMPFIFLFGGISICLIYLGLMAKRGR